jgi:hypothetical protein
LEDLRHTYTNMGGCTALGILNTEMKTVRYWTMSPMSLDEIINYLDHPLKTIEDVAEPLMEGVCSVDVFKSPEFQEEHDVIWSVIFQADSIVCCSGKKIAILRNRRG